MDEHFISKVDILYVEDEESIRDRLVRFLRRRTERLFVASNGLEGLEIFKSRNIDLVITDIRMPVMDGLTMSENIREIDQDVPIIITTGHNDEEFFLRSIDIGIDKYLKKPINFKDFISTVEKFSGNVIRKHQLAAQNEFVRTVMDNNPQFLFITDGSDISYINKSFLKFMKVDSLESFKIKYSSFNEVLVDGENSVYGERDFSDWIQDLIHNPDEAFYLYMEQEGSLAGTKEIGCYGVTMNKVPNEDEWLVSLTDITKIDREKQLYKVLSFQDPLTGIYNRKKFYDELNKEMERVKRYDQRLSLVMFDVDKFKNVNDTYGHQVGDEVLIEITNIVTNTIRKTDVFSRYGGEEFAILMPGTFLEGAVEIADRLRKLIECHHFRSVGRVTCSFGVSGLDALDNTDSFILKADTALYKAKGNGRNRVEKFDGQGYICKE